MASARRTELAAFLRARRERIQPEDVGLPPGTRRRTAGLRREELAQLAGVGVTWYTWLEQGRKINASVQVLDAIATTLRLDATERAHLFRLADVPGASRPGRLRRLPAAARGPADRRRDPAPGRRAHRAVRPAGLEPGIRVDLPRTSPRPRPASATRCSPTSPAPPAAARWRIPTSTATRWSRSCGPPTAATSATPPGRTSSAAWRRSARRSPPPGRPTTCPRRPAYTKHFRHPGVGPITTTTTSFAVNAVPGARLVVYTPDDEQSRHGPRPAGRGRPAGRPLPLLVRPSSGPGRAAAAGAR